MPTKFLESLSSKLGEQWVTGLLTPAFAFWLGSILAWIDRFGWDNLQHQFTQLVEPLQIAVLVSILLIITISGFTIQKFDLAILQFFEGYWHPWLTPLRNKLIAQQQHQFDRLDSQWQHLQNKQVQPDFTTEDREQLIAIDWQLRQFPAQRDRIMPTRLGNILRSAESQPDVKYGLDSIICWSRLWLVLPDGVKKELQETRADLNAAARIWIWGILFLVWAIWAWWAIPVGLFVAWFAYGWMLESASTYGDLLEAAFDLYRLELYKALHFPLPQNPDEERKLGQQLTEYLWRGGYRNQPDFVHSDA